MRLLLTAEIDADTEQEAQHKLDALREFLADTRFSVYDGITLYRARRVEVRDALQDDPEFSQALLYTDAEKYEHVPGWRAEDIETDALA